MWGAAGQGPAQGLSPVVTWSAYRGQPELPLIMRVQVAVENIDIGGPGMIRAAAKNHEHVTGALR
jgi:AICAR transformylase/IMP cyclohydrolase PurH